jgi:hypothetical protein
MTLALDLAATALAAPPSADALDTLAASIDPAWIEAALAATGTASVRRRRLPAEQVVWLVLAMALFRERPLDEIVAALGLAPGPRPLAPSAIPQARDRLGAAPLQDLMERAVDAWTDGAAATPTTRWHGLRVLALDGTTFRVPDSDANRTHFGAPHGAKGAAAYPVVRAVALLDARTHLLWRATFGPSTTTEHALANTLWAHVPGESVLLLDRHYVAARIFLAADPVARRHVVVRGKVSTAGRVVAILGPGDELLDRTTPAALRQQDPTLPATYRVRRIRYQRPGFRPARVLTTLLDAVAYPAAELVALYHERWEIELAYDEVKTVELQAQPTLRSQTPPRVEQEIWGLLLVYNLVRREMALTARDLGVAPTALSFATCLRAVRDEWWWLRVTKAGAIPARLRDLRTRLARLVLPARRPERHYERVVKRRSSYTTRGGRRRAAPTPEGLN